jgi:hypothetical protein
MSVGYVSLEDLINKGSAGVDVPYRIQFPVTDITALQGFSQWCNAIHGTLALKLKIGKDGIVYKQVNPAYVLRRVRALAGTDTAGDCTYNVTTPQFFQDLSNPTYFNAIDRNWAEAGTPYRFQPYTQNTTTNRVTAGTMLTHTLMVTDVVARIKINQRGYNVSPGSLQALKALYAQPQYIRSLFLTYEPFVSRLDFSGNGSYAFNATKTISAKYFRALALFFPMTGTNRVVFPRIALQNLQLELDGRKYPEDPISVDDMRLYRMTRLAAHMGDEPFSKSFTRSLTAETHDSSGTIHPRTLGDQTGFCVVIPLERPNSTNTFDGYASFTGLVKVNLKGEFVWKGRDALPGPYAFPIQAPEIWIPNEAWIQLNPSDGRGLAIEYHWNELIPSTDAQGF